MKRSYNECDSPKEAKMQKCDEKNILQILNEYVILNICDYLPGKSLQVFASTCKELKVIIEGSHKLKTRRYDETIANVNEAMRLEADQHLIDAYKNQHIMVDTRTTHNFNSTRETTDVQDYFNREITIENLYLFVKMPNDVFVHEKFFVKNLFLYTSYTTTKKDKIFFRSLHGKVMNLTYEAKESDLERRTITEICSWHMLKHLSINNNIMYADLDVINTNLESIHLYQYSHTATLVDVLRVFPNLKHLYIEYSNIIRTIRAERVPTSGLQTFELDLIHYYHTPLNFLTNITKLSFDYCDIDEFLLKFNLPGEYPNTLAEGCANVKVLQLMFSKDTYDRLEEFIKCFPSLEKVILVFKHVSLNFNVRLEPLRMWYKVPGIEITVSDPYNPHVFVKRAEEYLKWAKEANPEYDKDMFEPIDYNLVKETYKVHCARWREFIKSEFPRIGISTHPSTASYFKRFQTYADESTHCFFWDPKEDCVCCRRYLYKMKKDLADDYNGITPAPEIPRRIK